MKKIVLTICLLLVACSAYAEQDWVKEDLGLSLFAHVVYEHGDYLDGMFYAPDIKYYYNEFDLIVSPYGGKYGYFSGIFIIPLTDVDTHELLAYKSTVGYGYSFSDAFTLEAGCIFTSVMESSTDGQQYYVNATLNADIGSLELSYRKEDMDLNYDFVHAKISKSFQFGDLTFIPAAIAQYTMPQNDFVSGSGYDAFPSYELKGTVIYPLYKNMNLLGIIVNTGTLSDEGKEIGKLTSTDGKTNNCMAYVAGFQMVY